MNNRKSLANPIVENLRSPAKSLRRSSIIIRQPTVELIDNDDEAERASLRLEAKSVPSPPSSNRLSLGVGSTIGAMSSPQIAEGIAECIKLNTQNKINMKNAFNLNMIDFMSYLVRNRDDGISNLHVAGTSLDVSAKIYALRVDVLHQDILKMAGNLDHKDRRDDEDNNNEADRDTAPVSSQNDEQLQIKKKKKRSSRKIRTTVECLMGDVDTVSLDPIMFGEADCQTTDTLYQVMLPQHCGVGLGLHPYNDIFYDYDSDNLTNGIGNEPRIAWPPVQFDMSRDIGTVYPNFEFLNWSSDQECDEAKSLSQEASALIDDNLAFDLDASLPLDEEPPAFADKTFYDVNDDNEENAEGYHVQVRKAESIVNMPNFIPNLANKRLDYSFFNDVNIRWIGPAHWKIKSVTKHLGTSKIMEACRQGAGRKKKELNLIFDDNDTHCDTSLIVPKKSTAKLHAKTPRIVWSEKKLELPRDKHDDTSCGLFQFFLRPDDIINFIKNDKLNATVLSNESDEYNYNNENDATNYCPNNDIDDGQVDGDAHDSPYNTNAALGEFVGDNLIIAPKLTQKIFIPYSQRAKKLDMRRLKNCIWQDLLSRNKDNNEKQNINIDDIEQNMHLIKDEVQFSEIFIDLPKKLPNNDADELTFATAFVSLLHLANEKSLKLVSTPHYSDVIITHDL